MPRSLPRTAALLLLLAPTLPAQGVPAGPPPLLLFVREEVKPGRGAAHAAAEVAWAKALAKGKSTEYYLGMSALTGPNDAWFLIGYGSYADWEKKRAAMDANPALKKEIDGLSQADGEQLASTRSFLGAFRRDLSFGAPVEIGKMRYLRTRIFRVKQGHNKAFEDGVKVALAAYEKSHYPAVFAFFEVVAGMPSPSYVTVRPMKSLAEMDAFDAADKAFQEALGEDGQKTMQKVFADTVNSVENQLFAFDPKLSHPAPSTVASDPGYWAPKPAKEEKK